MSTDPIHYEGQADRLALMATPSISTEAHSTSPRASRPVPPTHELTAEVIRDLLRLPEDDKDGPKKLSLLLQQLTGLVQELREHQRTVETKAVGLMQACGATLSIVATLGALVVKGLEPRVLLPWLGSIPLKAPLVVVWVCSFIVILVSLFAAFRVLRVRTFEQVSLAQLLQRKPVRGSELAYQRHITAHVALVYVANRPEKMAKAELLRGAQSMYLGAGILLLIFVMLVAINVVFGTSGV